MHEVPGVLLLLYRGLRGEVGRHTVEERPGPAAQLHPVRRTLMVLGVTPSLLLNSSTILTSRGWDSLHEGLEVGAGPAGTAMDLLCSHQDSWFLLLSTKVVVWCGVRLMK